MMMDDLADLRHHWGGAYVIDHPAPGCWQAVRRDGKGTICADNPELLREMVRADYQAAPVPRGEPDKRANDSDVAEGPSLVLFPERQVTTRDQCG